MTNETREIPSRWLITGGCGFIGRNLVRRLATFPHVAVRIVDNLSVGSRADLSYVAPHYREIRPRDLDGVDCWREGFELLVGDVVDVDLAMRATGGADVVVHLAANTGVQPSVDDPRADCVTNVIGTFNYLEGARNANTNRFVFASSGAPVGECTPPIHEELAPHPVSPYGASKLAGEGYCSAYFRTFGLETVALRFGNVYGPYSGHKSSVVAKFIRTALQRGKFEVFGDGGQTRDFVYVEDLVDAIIAAATVSGVGGEVFQIATASETTVAELVAMIMSVLAANGITLPEVQFAAARRGDVRRNFSDTTKARTRLSWTARTELGEGLQRTLLWFLQRDGENKSTSPAQSIETSRP